MSRWCVVGNGPSAIEHADRIDRCDVVIRCNAFPLDGRAGDRWHVWASYFDATICMCAVRAGLVSHVPSVLWFTLPGNRTPAPDWRAVKGFAGPNREVLQVPRETWDLESAKLTAANDRKWVSPTTGFTAVHMALERAPAELVIVGFDATEPGKPGWGEWSDAQPRWPGPPKDHDLAAEKELLARWAEERVFCGLPFPKTRPTWLKLKR